MAKLFVAGQEHTTNALMRLQRWSLGSELVVLNPIEVPLLIFPKSLLQTLGDTEIWKQLLRLSPLGFFSSPRAPAAPQSPPVPGHATSSWIILDHFSTGEELTFRALKSPNPCASVLGAWSKPWAAACETLLWSLETLMGGTGQDETHPKGLLQCWDVSRSWDSFRGPSPYSC